ncbi:glutaredoxin 3 [Sporosarcina luteola]|nr:glutaredoxin 3 [Sporosarcina luteola]
MENARFELYTRPTCSDCQDAKAFLEKHHIPYINYDLSTDPEREEELIKLSGSRIVPAFVFRKRSLFGFKSKPEVFIGFERNREEIKKRLNR